MSISRRVVLSAVEARLKLLSGLTVYKGEVVNPPLIQTGGVPDSSGRVAPYAVIYGGGGRPNVEPDLADVADDLAIGMQITVAAGYEEDAAYTVDRVHAQIYRWAPDLGAGVVVGKFRPPIGFEPGTIRRDDDYTPPRFYLPLLYQLTATT